MVRKNFKVWVVVALLMSGTTALAAGGLVPCDGPECQVCHFVQLGQKLLTWFIGISASIIAFMFAWGGMQMVMSAGEAGGISKGKAMMTNSLIGFVILLASWLIVDTFLKMFVDGSKRWVWNEISCVSQPEYAWTTNMSASRGVSASSPSVGTLPSAKGAVGTYKTQLCTIATNGGVGDCSSLLAIMTQESGGNPNAVSKAGATGLMQVTPDAARSLDPSLKGLSDDSVRERLLDPTYNMQLAVKYYDILENKFGDDKASIYAAYNGGVGATSASRDCPGLERWECVWDSPGCYGTANTNCTPNTGYAETRDYVKKVTNYATTYGS